MELTEIHPGILIVYYLILALSAFLFSNPYYMITFIVLMLFLIYLQGVRSELVNVMKRVNETRPDVYCLLAGSGYLLEEMEKIKSDNTIYLPAEDLNRLTVREVLKRIDTDGSENFKIDHTGEYSHEWQALARAKEAYYRESEVLLKDL